MTGFLSAARHIRERRRVLSKRFDVARQMSAIEETCIPSYVHPNLAAACVAWARLFAATAMYRRFAPQGPVLDFGSGPGELAELIPGDRQYNFVEIDEEMARYFQDHNPRAVRRTDLNLPAKHYGAVFALDSLEHNPEVGAILERIKPSLAEGGVLILSGPTENWLYRLGRRIAGFSGTYHLTTIYDIEEQAARRFRLVSRRRLPFGIPMFSISCWAAAT